MFVKTAIVTTLFVFMALPAVADEPLPKIPQSDTRATMPMDENQGKALTVDCYIGNPNEGRNLGTIIVTSEAEAGPACNQTYCDCQNRCYGCLTEGSTVCYDRSGKKFSR
jgi:hypothetical protein